MNSEILGFIFDFFFALLHPYLDELILNLFQYIISFYEYDIFSFEEWVDGFGTNKGA